MLGNVLCIIRSMSPIQGDHASGIIYLSLEQPAQVVRRADNATLRRDLL